MNNVVEQDVIERTLERESAVLSIKNDTKINEGRGKGSGAPTFRGSRQEKSAVLGLALTQRTGKQDALLSFSHREKPITGIS